MSRAALDRRPTVARRGVLVVASAAAFAACHGPRLQVDSADPVYRDGARLETGVPEPFRYYGTTVLDAVPAEQKGRPDFARQQSRTLVAVAAPVTPWIFPLDFFVELFAVPFEGPVDQTVAVEAAPSATKVSVSFQPEGLEPLRTRAFAARSSR